MPLISNSRCACASIYLLSRALARDGQAPTIVGSVLSSRKMIEAKRPGPCSSPRHRCVVTVCERCRGRDSNQIHLYNVHYESACGVLLLTPLSSPLLVHRSCRQLLPLLVAFKMLLSVLLLVLLHVGAHLIAAAPTRRRHTCPTKASSPVTDAHPPQTGCFPALGFQMPENPPSGDIDTWWCDPKTEYAFLGFSYEISACA